MSAPGHSGGRGPGSCRGPRRPRGRALQSVGSGREAKTVWPTEEKWPGPSGSRGGLHGTEREPWTGRARRPCPWPPTLPCPGVRRSVSLRASSEQHLLLSSSSRSFPVSPAPQRAAFLLGGACHPLSPSSRRHTVVSLFWSLAGSCQSGFSLRARTGLMPRAPSPRPRVRAR